MDFIILNHRTCLFIFKLKTRLIQLKQITEDAQKYGISLEQLIHLMKELYEEG